MTDDAVQRRLHRAGRNLERLQKIGANPDRHDDGDEDDFDVFPPVRFPCGVSICAIYKASSCLRSVFIGLLRRAAEGRLQPADLRLQFRERALAQNVA